MNNLNLIISKHVEELNQNTKMIRSIPGGRGNKDGIKNNYKQEQSDMEMLIGHPGAAARLSLPGREKYKSWQPAE